MMPKNIELIKEVTDEIESALKDPIGLVSHQRRLAFLLSLGTVALIEDYLSKLNVFKSGAKIDHRWLKKNKNNVKALISNQITCPIENIGKIDAFLDLAFKIEKERNDIAYGKKVTEGALKEKISIFLDFKKEVENA